MLWSIIPKRIGHTEINELVRKYFYDWILQHPQDMQYSIANYCCKASIDGEYEPQLVPKLLLKCLYRNFIISC